MPAAGRLPRPGYEPPGSLPGQGWRPLGRWAPPRVALLRSTGPFRQVWLMPGTTRRQSSRPQGTRRWTRSRVGPSHRPAPLHSSRGRRRITVSARPAGVCLRESETLPKAPACLNRQQSAAKGEPRAFRGHKRESSPAPAHQLRVLRLQVQDQAGTNTQPCPPGSPLRLRETELAKPDPPCRPRSRRRLAPAGRTRHTGRSPGDAAQRIAGLQA